MNLLIVAALVWIGVHIGIAGTQLRGMRWCAASAMARSAGCSPPCRLPRSIFLVTAWRGSSTEALWYAPSWLRWLLVAAMLVAFLLFVASVSAPNPTMIGPAGVATRPPRGVQRITRHPMLWSFAIWAAVHIIGNGDTAAIVFFGAFLVTALAGMPSIDAKLARRDPATWHALSATTSIVPFGAIAQGRNRLVLREFGWLTPLIAVVAWALLLHLHPWLFGVAPVAL